MTTISIIGTGSMATAIGTRTAKHGHTIELMSRNTASGAEPLGRDPASPKKAETSSAAGSRTA
jgi:3-hydroxyisobutyrate dehydrogenase-like beta-hydroxyacid dehydrogenase